MPAFTIRFVDFLHALSQLIFFFSLKLSRVSILCSLSYFTKYIIFFTYNGQYCWHFSSRQQINIKILISLFFSLFLLFFLFFLLALPNQQEHENLFWKLLKIPSILSTSLPLSCLPFSPPFSRWKKKAKQKNSRIQFSIFRVCCKKKKIRLYVRNSYEKSSLYLFHLQTDER